MFRYNICQLKAHVMYVLTATLYDTNNNKMMKCTEEY